jgi:hypothetical protein
VEDRLFPEKILAFNPKDGETGCPQLRSLRWRDEHTLEQDRIDQSMAQSLKMILRYKHISDPT